MEIKTFSGAELARGCAEFVAKAAEDAVAQNGIFVLGISGGETPKTVFEILASQDFAGKSFWGKTHVFWADERFVPQDDEENNYHVARETLFDKLPVKPQLYPVNTGMKTSEAAAKTYGETICSFERTHTGRKAFFDLILLGIGADGHTASLFPNRALTANTAPALAVTAPPGIKPEERITLTVPMLSDSGTALFLVSGAKKRAAMREIASGKPLPPLMILPRGKAVIFCDREAFGG
jgi:6-phosphogluconolactonase